MHRRTFVNTRAGHAPICVREQIGRNPTRVSGSSALSARWAGFADGRSRQPRISLVDSTALGAIRRYQLAPKLRQRSLTGYSVLILDDRRSYIDEAKPATVIFGRPTEDMQRFAVATQAVKDALKRPSDRRAILHNFNLCIATAAWKVQHFMHVSGFLRDPALASDDRHRFGP